GAGEKLAGRIVIYPGFEQRLPDALRDPAMDLAFDQHRLQYIPAIVDRVVSDELDCAGIGVNLHLGDMAAVRKRGRHVGWPPAISRKHEIPSPRRFPTAAERAQRAAKPATSERARAASRTAAKSPLS